MKKISPLIIFSICIASLAGCGTVPESIVQQPMTARPQQAAAVPSPNGAIFQAVAYRPMFEDRRARLIGDILTITISEKTSAAKSIASSGSKDAAVSANPTALFGLAAADLAHLTATGAIKNKFEEKGAASASNTFTGSIGVTVVEVLANGNLLVSGEKQIAFDKGAEFVRFSGVVSPDMIASGNIVSSTQVADARIEYRTNSRIDKAEFLSQIARFFFSFAPL